MLATCCEAELQEELLKQANWKWNLSPAGTLEELGASGADNSLTPAKCRL